MIWNEEFETLPREALDALQLKRLKRLLEKVYHLVPYYRHLFDKENFFIESIRSLDDIKRIPFTCKDDLRKNYPFGLFATPHSNILRIHSSSGTTGKPTVVGYTKRDISIWSEILARMFSASGVSRGDILQNAYGYGLFTGGLGVHYGAELIGATVVPISGGNSKRQIMFLKDFGTTVLTCTPSYVLNLYEIAQDMGININKLSLRVGIFGAEQWTYEMRHEIEEKWNIDALDIYGLSEIIGPGVAFECLEAKRGLHINEDHFIAEIIDPETGEKLPCGETGELVLTTITKEGMPLVRYRTSDITNLISEPCACGRTSIKMEKIMGRCDDMFIIRGVNVFPSQIESILVSMEGVLPHYQLVIEREKQLDTLEVLVEVNDKYFSDEVKILQNLGRKIENEIKSNIGISSKVKLLESKSLARCGGGISKISKVVDKRGQN